jgi:hypothetical protein
MSRAIMTAHRRPAALLALLWTLVAAVALDAKGPHDDRIRTLDPRLAELVQEGIARSGTFSDLVQQLTRGDVVVYVRYDPLPAGVHGSLSFLSRAAGVRYVLVSLTADLDTPRSIVVLGHELRHAVEVVDQPSIVDTATFAAAYEQVTYRRRHLANGGVGLDTIAAVEAGVQIWKEMAVAPDVAVAGTR